jgi:cold-inducible RNA-binding protein
MARKWYVGNLSYNVGETELHALFSGIGEVETVTVMRDHATGQARGFAFVEMRSEEDAQRATTELNETQFEGRRLTVNEARPKPQGAGFGGGGGGGRGGFGGGGGGGNRRREPRW